MAGGRAAVLKLGGLAGLTALAAAGGWAGLGPATLAPLVALGATAARELAPNIGAQLLLDSADAVDHVMARRGRDHRNHDIHRLIGKTIATIIDRELAGTGRDNAYLARAAAAFRSDPWFQLALTAEDGASPASPLAAVSETDVARYFTGSPDSIKSVPTLEIDEWLNLIERVAAGPPPIGSQAAVRYSAQQLRAGFAAELWEAAKDAERDGDRAWPALMLRLLSEILGRATHGNDAMLRELAGIRSDIAKLADRVIEVGSQTGLRGDLEADAVIGISEAYRRDIGDSLHAMEALVSRQEALEERLSELPDAIVKKLGDRMPRRTCIDNLAAAGATHNLAFVGRAKELDALSQLLHDPDGPAAVAIVAGAGFGKTEIAKAFVTTRARPVDSAPDGWTARWWLDGSRDGEIKSLREHFETITGQLLPPERAVLPNERAADVMAGWLQAQRRTIAQACSRGRCLLVIDNAETAQQLLHYRPGNAGRLLATTRRQPIPRATAVSLVVDEMSPDDARALLVGDREALLTAEHGPVVDELAEHVGRHALALAYVAAALARPPCPSPGELLQRLQHAEVGDDSHLLTEFDHSDIGTGYVRPLAQSLALLLDELAVPGNPSHDPFALTLLELAAFCAPVPIPIDIFQAATGAPRHRVERSLRVLHERSIVSLGDSVRVHRLTQSLMRGRVKRDSPAAVVERLQTLSSGLLALYRRPSAPEEQRVLHVHSHLRTVSWPHADAAIRYALELESPQASLQAAAHALRSELAWHLMEIGRPHAALIHIGEAIRWLKAQPDADAARMAHCRALRADISKRCGDLAGASRDIGAAIAWAEQQTLPDERTLFGWYETRAGIRQGLDDLAGALADVNRAIAWAEAQHPPDEFLLAWWHGSRARIRHGWGDMAGASADLARTIAWREAQHPPNHHHLVVDYALRARIRQSMGNLEGALSDIQRAIDWRLAQVPRDERGLGYDHAYRASIRQDRGDLEGAAADIEIAIARGESEIPRDERTLAVWHAWRAGIRRDRGDLSGAASDIARSIAWWEAHAPDLDRGLAMWYGVRAGIRLDSGDLAGAAGDIAWAISRGEAHQPRDERRLALWYAARADISHREASAAMEAGNRREAERLLDAGAIGIGRSIEWYDAHAPLDHRRRERLLAIQSAIERTRDRLHAPPPRDR